jgi:hypothetical protein
MIKVEIYEGSFDWENEEPKLVLTLKDYQERYNNGDYEVQDVYKIRFVIV